MGTDATRGGRRTARKPKRPVITDDAIRDLYARAVAAERSEAHRYPPGVTDDTTPVPRETQCPSCFGAGTSVCLSCFGLGCHTTSYATTDWEGNVDYVTEEYPCGCSGGRVACGTCGGRGSVFR